MTEIYISELERPLISVAIDGSKYYVVSSGFEDSYEEFTLHKFDTLAEAERFVAYDRGEIDYETYHAPNTAVVDYVGHIHRPPFCRKCGANLVRVQPIRANVWFSKYCPICTPQPQLENVSPSCERCGANLIKQVLVAEGTGFGALVVCCPVCPARVQTTT